MIIRNKEKRMKRILLYSISVSLLFAFFCSAEPSKEDLQQKAAAIKQAAADNQASLRQYQWIETTQVAMKGEIKSTTQKACSYGSDGKVIKTPMASPQQPQQEQKSSGGRHPREKEKIGENKKAEMTAYMQKAAALVQQYVPPSPEKIQNAIQSGNLAVNPSAGPGIASLIFKNYNLEGDSMTLGISQSDKKLVNLVVNSYLDDPKDAVNLFVTFATLPDGTSYPGQSVLDVTAKKMKVTITNSDYKKAGM
jgi:hypothetical protein